MDGPISEIEMRRILSRHFGAKMENAEIRRWQKMNGNQNSFPAKVGENWDILLVTEAKEETRLQSGETLTNGLRSNAPCLCALCVDKRQGKNEVRPFKIV